MNLWKTWLYWITGGLGAGAAEHQAFHWIRGRVGQRQNPDGMRSLIHHGVGFAALALALDLWLVDPAELEDLILISALHLVWISALLTLLVFNVGFLETLDGRMLEHLNGANILTLGRLFLLPTLAGLIAGERYGLAAAGYIFLALTDVLDGLWARWRGQITKLGVILDPLTDAAFHAWVFGSLWLVQIIPSWLFVLVAVRYTLLIGGGIVLYLAKGQIRVLPTPFGKATGILLTVATALLLFLPNGTSDAIEWLIAGLGVVLSLTILHVLAIGVVNLKLPLQTPPARAQVRGRWARTLARRSSDPPPEE